MAAILNGSEIILSGMVGGSSGDAWSWEPDGFSASDVITALAQIGAEAPVTVRINSGGGYATEGSAIHAALAQHKGPVTVVVEGIAASAASVIAMAADTLVMSLGSVLMIHEAAGVTIGDATAHAQAINALNALGDSYASIYADKTGRSVAEMRDLMKAETWMTAEEAVSGGFADAVAGANDNVPEGEANAEPTAFAYGLYQHAPERLVAMANARNWKPKASLFVAPKPTAEDVSEVVDDVEETTTEGEEHDVQDQEPEAPSAEDLVEIAALCVSAGLTAAQARDFIRDGGTVDKAREKAADAATIREDIARAKRINPALVASLEDYVARGFTVEQARADLLNAVTAQAEISTATVAPALPPAPPNYMAEAHAKVASQNKRR